MDHETDTVSRAEFEALRVEIAELKLSRMQKARRIILRNKRAFVAGVSMGLIIPAAISALSITKTHTFTAGNPTVASEVNANFDQLFTKANELDGTLTGMISQLAKAWVKFRGTSCSPNCLILASHNVATVTRNAAGDYSVFFSTALADANYVTSIAATGVFNGTHIILEGTSDGGLQPNTTTSFRFKAFGTDLNAADPLSVHIVVFGN